MCSRSVNKFSLLRRSVRVGNWSGWARGLTSQRVVTFIDWDCMKKILCFLFCLSVCNSLRNYWKGICIKRVYNIQYGHSLDPGDRVVIGYRDERYENIVVLERVLCIWWKMTKKIIKLNSLLRRLNKKVQAEMVRSTGGRECLLSL